MGKRIDHPHRSSRHDSIRGALDGGMVAAIGGFNQGIISLLRLAQPLGDALGKVGEYAISTGSFETDQRL